MCGHGRACGRGRLVSQSAGREMKTSGWSAATAWARIAEKPHKRAAPHMPTPPPHTLTLFGYLFLARQ